MLIMHIQLSNICAVKQKIH